MTTPKRSDRWHRLDALLGGLDDYVTTRRRRGESWHQIVLAIGAGLPPGADVQAPTVATLTRWYPHLNTRSTEAA